MKYIHGKTEFNLSNTCVTLGKFDGLHLGHQLLFEQLKKEKKTGYQSVMFTFDYHPSNLFSEKELALIYTEEEKRYLLEKSFLDVFISYPFTDKTASIEPEEFIEKVLIEKLDAKIIVVGDDFRFGKKRRGDVKLLQQLSTRYNYQVKVFEKRKIDNKIISSTLIRTELAKGNIEYANELLGSPYSIIGEVQHGREIGRTIGMPTVNLIPSKHKLLPPNGVYASITKFDNKMYQGITNIGYKPTVGGEARRGVETYLFQFNNQIYGKKIQVELCTYERAEQKFDSLEELKTRIEKDVKFGRRYFQLKMF